MQMALADRLTAILFFALGLVLLYGGWTMDRLEIRQIHPASIPGLVPMILGVLLSFCSVLLFLKSFPDTDSGNEDDCGKEMMLSGGSWARLGLTAVICTVYAVALIGTVNYSLATAIFSFVFALIFSFPVNGDRRAQAVAVFGAILLSLCVAFGSAYMFRELFLVRLP